MRQQPSNWYWLAPLIAVAVGLSFLEYPKLETSSLTCSWWIAIKWTKTISSHLSFPLPTSFLWLVKKGENSKLKRETNFLGSIMFSIVSSWSILLSFATCDNVHRVLIQVLTHILGFAHILGENCGIE